MCTLSPCYTCTELFHLFDSKSQMDDVKRLILHHPVDFWQLWGFCEKYRLFLLTDSHHIESSALWVLKFPYFFWQKRTLQLTLQDIFFKLISSSNICYVNIGVAKVCFAVLTIHLNTIKVRHFHNHFKLIICQTINLKLLWKFLTLVSLSNCNKTICVVDLR